jgi:hypothetical protein
VVLGAPNTNLSTLELAAFRLERPHVWHIPATDTNREASASHTSRGESHERSDGFKVSGSIVSCSLICIRRELSERPIGRNCPRKLGRGTLNTSVTLVTISSRGSLKWPSIVAASLQDYQISEPGVKTTLLGLPSNARTTYDIKIVVKTEIVTVTIETSHQR